jgi:hypothetical protein
MKKAKMGATFGVALRLAIRVKASDSLYIQRTSVLPYLGLATQAAK